MGPVELIVQVFPGEQKAVEVLRDLRTNVRRGNLRLVSSAALLKDQNGKTSLEESEDVDARQGAVFGAIAGALIGLLAGPAGAIVGAAAGAATGGVAASRIDLGFSREFLKELKTALKPGSSALMVLVETKWVDRVIAEMVPYQGKVIRHALKTDLAKQLERSDRT